MNAPVAGSAAELGGFVDEDDGRVGFFEEEDFERELWVDGQLLLVRLWLRMERTPRKPMMVVMYSVQRQPRYDMLMKPPMNGASNGL